jgi:hypothetical protein
MRSITQIRLVVSVVIGLVTVASAAEEPKPVRSLVEDQANLIQVDGKTDWMGGKVEIIEAGKKQSAKFRFFLTKGNHGIGISIAKNNYDQKFLEKSKCSGALFITIDKPDGSAASGTTYYYMEEIDGKTYLVVLDSDYENGGGPEVTFNYKLAGDKLILSGGRPIPYGVMTQKLDLAGEYTRYNRNRD